MKKDPRIHVSFILECIELVEEYLEGLTETEFLNSTQQQDAIIRRIEKVDYEAGICRMVMVNIR